MQSNITLDKFTRLKSAKDVFNSKKGSSHDQVIFELHELRRMGCRAKAMFFMEYKDGLEHYGFTHSFVYWTIKTSNKIFWFENSLNGQNGIKSFRSVKEMKDYISKLYKFHKFGNFDRYGKLHFTKFGNHKRNEKYKDFIDNCIK